MRSLTLDTTAGPVHAADYGGSGPAMLLVDPAVPPQRRKGFGRDRIARNAVLAYGLPTPASIRLKRLADKRGAERLVGDILSLCAVDVRRIDAAVMAAHVQLERERLR